MQKEDYLVAGETKMIDIDFSVVYPSTSYFVSVNMLIEISLTGQVIPTRIDIMPYKLSAFTTHNSGPTKTIDLLKFLLVIYTFYAVLVNF